MKHIVFYSGGIGSWMTAKRVIEQHGKEDVILLFTDTLIEDEDLYRFIDETVKEMGVEYVRIEDGRTPWEVFKDVRWLGNSRLAQCSHHLKQKTADKWIKENFKPLEPLFIKNIDHKKKEVIYWDDPEVISNLQKEWEKDERETCQLYLGIDWTEEHRTESPKFNWLPYKVEFPLCESPYLSKDEMLTELNRLGIETPKLYKLGFSHNNCAGMCVKGGQGHFINLLKHFPDRYEWMENFEKEMQEYLGQEVTILKRTKNGITENLSLEQLRLDYETQPQQLDLFDMGGCGCMVNY